MHFTSTGSKNLTYPRLKLRRGGGVSLPMPWGKTVSQLPLSRHQRLHVGVREDAPTTWGKNEVASGDVPRHGHQKEAKNERPD
jgi:hypothetical protein